MAAKKKANRRKRTRVTKKTHQQVPDIAWREGARQWEVPAKVAHAEFERIRQRDGVVKAPVLLDENSDPVTPLYECFYKDADKDAARKHRLHLAKKLMADLVYVVCPENPDLGPSRVTVNVTTPNGRGYTDVRGALSVEETRHQILSEARRDFLRMRNRYQHLHELADLIRVIDRFLEDTVTS